MVELIAAVAIVAAVVTLGLVFVGGYIQDAKRQGDKQTLHVLNEALTRYKTQGRGVSGFTSGAPIKNVLARLQTPVNWNGLTHQVLQTGTTFIGRSIDAKGGGSAYRFTRYHTYIEEAGGTSPSGDALFTAVCSGSNQAAYSADGANWTSAVLPSSGSWLSPERRLDKIVAIRQSSSQAAYSADNGANWTPLPFRSQERGMNPHLGTGRL